MRNVYFGKKKERFVYECHRGDLLGYDVVWTSITETKVKLLRKRIIDAEKGNIDFHRTDFRIIDDEVILHNSYNIEKQIGDTVEINNLIGKVVDKKHDIVNDVMYHYTDIVTEIVDERGIEEKIEEIKRDSIFHLRHYLKHIESKLEEEKNKGFWKKLFKK